MLDTMFSEDDFVFKKELNSLLDKLLPINWDLSLMKLMIFIGNYQKKSNCLYLLKIG